MTYVLSCVMLALNSFKKKQKVIFVVSLVFMWILAGWSYGTADYILYSKKFLWSAQEVDKNEMLFSITMNVFKTLGLNFQVMIIVLFAISLLLVGYTIYKNSYAPNLVLALFFIFTFIMNATQFRAFVATAFFVFGFQFLMGNKKNGTLKYVIFVLIASGFHFAFLFMLLLIFAKYLSTYKIFILTLLTTCALILSCILLPSSFLSIISGTIVSSDKLSDIMQRTNDVYTLSTVATWVLRTIIYFTSICVILYFAKRSKKSGLLYDENVLSQSNMIIKCNILMLIILPILFLSVDIYRIQQALIIWNYIAILNFTDKTRKNATTGYNMLLYCVMIVFAVFELRSLVLSNGNVDTVFFPLFNNNLLLK